MYRPSIMSYIRLTFRLLASLLLMLCTCFNAIQCVAEGKPVGAICMGLIFALSVALVMLTVDEACSLNKENK